MSKVEVSRVTLSKVGVVVSNLFKANDYVNTLEEMMMSDGAWVIVEVLRFDRYPFALFKVDGEGNFEVIDLEIEENESDIRDLSLADRSAYAIASEYPEAFVVAGRYAGNVSDCLDEARSKYSRAKYERTFEVDGKIFTMFDSDLTMLQLYELVMSWD